MEKLQENQNPSENMLMYEVSGQSETTHHSIQRYLIDKKTWQEEIYKKAKESNLFLETKLMTLSPEKKKEIILGNFESEDIETHKKYFDLIPLLTEEDRLEIKPRIAQIVDKGLESKEEEIQNIYAKMIWNTPIENQFNLLRKGFLTNNSQVQITCAETIRGLTQEQAEYLIKQGLDSTDIRVQQAYAEKIWTLKEENPEKDTVREKISQIVEKAFLSNNSENQEIAAEMINLVPENEKAKYIQQGLNNANFEVQKISADMIHSMQDKQEKDFLKEIVYQMVKEAIKQEKVEYADMVQFTSQDKRISLIKQGFASSNPNICKTYAKIIYFAKEEERSEFIREKLQDPNTAEEINHILVKNICYARDKDKEELVSLAIQKGFGKSLIVPALYRGQKVVKEKFSRADFPKTDSLITLLGGSLKDKAIIRTIEPLAFLAWQKIYENSQVWKDAGFNYVPIEPIIAFRLNKENFVDVYCGVLDLDLQMWKKLTTRFNKQLDEQKNKILKVLEKEKLVHGHFYEHNMCLRFFRNKDGKIDFNTTPRLYIIDFDLSNSPVN